jgi:hypothetical protein
VDLPTAFAQFRSAFPSTAIFQGIHFKFADRNSSLLIEMKRGDRFFYWLLIESQFKLIHASQKSRLAPMKTIGESFPNLSLADVVPASLSVPKGRLLPPRSLGDPQALAPPP